VAKALDALQGRICKYETQLHHFRERLKEIKEDEEQVMVFPKKPKGLYIHGNVGTGKTILMDMFFETLPIEKKRRVHLHDFMNDVHERIHAWKAEEREKFVERQLEEKKQNIDKNVSQEEEKEQLVQFRRVSSESDGIEEIAKRLAQEHTLLAFDEFVVTDVVNALILKHLFGTMFKNGAVVVATSNTAPEDLYKDGLNYFYFAPFIGVLKTHCKVVGIDSETDYRIVRAEGSLHERYLFPINEKTKARFEEIFDELSRGEAISSKTISVAFGRSVTAKACTESVCRFDFAELCSDRQPIMGTADFKALCSNFETTMIENVPQLGIANHNETRRFINLVDQMYDQGVNVVILSNVQLKELVKMTQEKSNMQSDGSAATDEDLFSLKEMQVAAKRLSSRLVEMTQSPI